MILSLSTDRISTSIHFANSIVNTWIRTTVHKPFHLDMAISFWSIGFRHFGYAIYRIEILLIHIDSIMAKIYWISCECMLFWICMSVFFNVSIDSIWFVIFLSSWTLLLFTFSQFRSFNAPNVISVSFDFVWVRCFVTFKSDICDHRDMFKLRGSVCDFKTVALGARRNPSALKHMRRRDHKDGHWMLNS